eukprot:s276_g22.t1
MQGVSWDGAIPAFFLGAFAAFLAAVVYYWYHYFAPRLWPQTDERQDGPMPVTAGTATPIPTAVPVLSFKEPEVRKIVVSPKEDVQSESGMTPPLRSAADAGKSPSWPDEPEDLRFDNPKREEQEVKAVGPVSAWEEQERALRDLEEGLQNDLRRDKEAVFSQRAMDICKEDFAD